MNSRMPDTIYGDVWAQIAAVRIGAKRLQELAKKYGSNVFERAMIEFMDSVSYTHLTLPTKA